MKNTWFAAIAAVVLVLAGCETDDPETDGVENTEETGLVITGTKLTDCDKDKLPASLTIPDSVRTIADGVFMGCTKLERVDISDNVTVIGNDAFSGCTSLMDIYYGGSEAQWENISVNAGVPDGASVHYGKKPTSMLDKTALCRFGTTNLNCDFDSDGVLTDFGNTGAYLYYPVEIDLDKDWAELTATITVSEVVGNQPPEMIGIGFIVVNDGIVDSYGFATTVKAIRLFGGTDSLTDENGNLLRNGKPWDTSSLGIDFENKPKLCRANVPYTFKAILSKKKFSFTMTDASGVVAARGAQDCTKFVNNDGKVYLAIGSISGSTSKTAYSDISVTINGGICTIDTIEDADAAPGFELEKTSLYRLYADGNCDFDSDGVLTDFGGTGSCLYYPVALDLDKDWAELTATVTVSEAVGKMGVGLIEVEDSGFVDSYVFATTANSIRCFGGTTAVDENGNPKEKSHGWSDDSTLEPNAEGKPKLLIAGIPYTFKVHLAKGNVMFTIIDASGIVVATRESMNWAKFVNNSGKVYLAIGTISGDTSNIAYSNINVTINGGHCIIDTVEDDDNPLSQYLVFGFGGTKVVGYRDGIPEDLVIPSGVTVIGKEAFRGCDVIKKVTVPDSVTVIEGQVFKECSSLTNIIIPNSVKSIGQSAFSWCTSLENVIIPNSVIEIGRWGFGCCKSLKSIEIPSSVTTLGGDEFSGCDMLEYVKLSAGIKEISNSMFYNCYALTTVEIPHGITAIGDSAFGYCFALESVEIPDGVTTIGKEAFLWCQLLKSITIPESVKSIGDGAFTGTNNLREIYYGGTKAQWEKNINAYITLLDDATIHCTDGDFAYLILDGTVVKGYKYSVENLVIPDGITEIGSAAFERCELLVSIAIPASVTKIDKYAFNQCENLMCIYYSGSMAQWEVVTGDGKSDLTAVTIHCTDGDINKN
ncbi:MAG: leucine-rich repeat protein [Treponema sp.]|nr:leucine-rich repeat protein [Treponema sp.]